jgi:hypothetical protein
MKFCFFFLFYFNLNKGKCEDFSENKGLLALRIYHTLGIETNIFLKKNTVKNSYATILQQRDMNGKLIANILWKVPNNQNRTFLEIIKKQETGNLLLETKIIYKNPSELQIISKDNLHGNNTSSSFKASNIYGFLKEITSIVIKDNYCPDYFALSNSLPVSSPDRSFHELFYKMYGVGKKHTANVYVYDTKNHTFGEILSILGTPAFVFYSGDGKETYLYVGLHVCKNPENKNKFYYGTLIFQCDVYGKIIKYFYNIDLCNFCHKYIQKPPIHCEDMTDKL